MHESVTHEPALHESALHEPNPAAATVPDRSWSDEDVSGSDEDGSLVTEYGLLAVVAATIAGVIIAWASNGALVSLFNALLRHARSLVGA